MRLSRLLRVSLVALAAATAVAAPGLYSTQGGVALAAAEPSSLAVQAAKLALAGDFVAAGEAAQRSGDAAAVKLVELIYLRDHPNDAGYPRIINFLETAPNWPLTESPILCTTAAFACRITMSVEVPMRFPACRLAT